MLLEAAVVSPTIPAVPRTMWLIIDIQQMVRVTAWAPHAAGVSQGMPDTQ